MKEKIEIPLSKSKLFLGIGGSILFVVVAIWLYLNSNNFQDNSFSLLRNPLVIKGVGVLGILFFGGIGIFGITNIFNKKIGLIIDDSGIIDNSNASSIGLIEWNDISIIETKQVMSTKFLLIHVKNPEKYIEKAQKGIKAKLMRSNMKMYGSPISITSNTLKYDFDALEELMQTEFKRNKNNM